MVFKHNKRPFTDDESYQHACKHSRQLHCGGQLASFIQISLLTGIPEKPPTSDGESRDINQSQAEERLGDETNNIFSVISKEPQSSIAAVVPDVSLADALGKTYSLSITSSNSEDARLEHNEQSSSNDKFCQRAYEHSRQVDYSSQVASIVEVPSSSGTFEQSSTSAAANKESEIRRVASVPEDPIKNGPGSNFNFSYFSCNRTEEDTRLEPFVRISFSPRYYEDDNQTAGFNHRQEIYSPVFDFPPRKHAALGPDHQADVPACGSKALKNSFGESDACVASPATSMASSSTTIHLLNYEGNNEKWIGTCVMPMPNSDPVDLESVRVGQCKTDCSCLDEGSIRCVRQHVMESREKLKKMVGLEKFVELGFCDMGEDVAKKWSEEEEHMFHEVVFSNPASLGKNFWDHLPHVFPSRSSKELVSYYFNVFMLRKRAEQNRSDALNVDSDNDEWQESNEGEFAIEEDEEDSAVESPIDRDDVNYKNDSHEEVDIHEEDEDGDAFDDYAIAGEEGLYDAPEGGINDKLNSTPIGQPVRQNLPDGVDQDVQDDSCTSYEVQHNQPDSSGGPSDIVASQDSLVKEDHEKLHREYRNDVLSGTVEQGYLMGHCSPKSWDISHMTYFHGPEKDVDFLPTCSVIEEVFGKGASENEARDGQGIS